MQPLIDADVLRYEVGFAAEAGWQEEGNPPFDYVADILDNRIRNICAIVEATEPPLLYLTGRGNFREKIATRKSYKDRPSVKPVHFKNITAYIKGKYDWILSNGCEADDEMAIEQTKRNRTGSPTVICTRDKDLRQVPGWHYGWELGGQPQFGPELVDSFGYIRLSGDRKKVVGTGTKFFYAQCLMGDPVDTVPGLDGCGPVKAFKILEHAKTSTEAFKAVLQAYCEKWEGLEYLAREDLLEQGRLLHMTRHRDEWGNCILWELPDGIC